MTSHRSSLRQPPSGPKKETLRAVRSAENVTLSSALPHRPEARVPHRSRFFPAVPESTAAPHGSSVPPAHPFCFNSSSRPSPGRAADAVIPNPAFRNLQAGAPWNLGVRHHDPAVSGTEDQSGRRGPRLARPRRKIMARPVLPHIRTRIHGRARAARRRHDLHGHGVHPPAQPDHLSAGRTSTATSRPARPDHRDRPGGGRDDPAHGLRRQGAPGARRRAQRLRCARLCRSRPT